MEHLVEKPSANDAEVLLEGASSSSMATKAPPSSSTADASSNSTSVPMSIDGMPGSPEALSAIDQFQTTPKPISKSSDIGFGVGTSCLSPEDARRLLATLFRFSRELKMQDKLSMDDFIYLKENIVRFGANQLRAAGMLMDCFIAHGKEKCGGVADIGKGRDVTSDNGSLQTRSKKSGSEGNENNPNRKGGKVLGSNQRRPRQERPRQERPRQRGGQGKSGQGKSSQGQG